MARGATLRSEAENIILKEKLVAMTKREVVQMRKKL